MGEPIAKQADIFNLS